MATETGSPPAFGQADLSNCEREQIHLAGSIQPHGALLVASEPGLVIRQASANAAAFLRDRRAVLGQRLDSLSGDIAASIRPHLSERLDAIPLAVRCHVGEPARAFDGLLHRTRAGELVVELEYAGPHLEMAETVGAGLQRIVDASSLRALADEVAAIYKALTGYDRVMVYRFDEDGHGEVFSEEREPQLEALLGNRYPATDIPQIARRLYERNRVRVLVDVEASPVPIRPRLSVATGEELDMSLCALRSMSPIHIQYLKNMGVCATLVASLIVGGKLWGLIACHHYRPRTVHFEVRAACELLAEAIGTRIAALESFVRAQAELSVRRLEQRLVEAIAREGDWRSALFDSSQSILQPVGATGAALLFEDQVMTVGDVPATAQLREIGRWVDSRTRAPVIATSSLSLDDETLAPVAGVASGVLAAPVSDAPGDYIMWFRPERIRTVTWGGNPFKPVLVGNDPAELSPRRSFAQWHQLVEGRSDPWSATDLTVGRLIGETLSDVVLQVRSVRMLIARHQLETVSGQVRQSEQPVLLADARGHVLLRNAAFERLIGKTPTRIQRLRDLLGLCVHAEDASRRLRDLLNHGRPWRGEIVLRVGSGEPCPVMVRADPVFSAPDRVLGYVVLLADVTERHIADAARKQFQENLIERNRVTTVRLDSQSDLVFQTLLSLFIENAQLAALEITDGVDTARIPAMLESVRTSVGRTANLLKHLIWHERQATD